MNLEPMYEPMPYSPATTLAEDIGEGDTSIVVTDASVFPEAPNIAVIGTKEKAAETIIYGSITENILGNVTRGVQGEAHAWYKGDTIARNFTALDQSSIQANIKALNDGAVDKTGDTMTGPLKIDSALETHYLTNIRTDVSTKSSIRQNSNAMIFTQYANLQDSTRTELFFRSHIDGNLAPNSIMIRAYDSANNTKGNKSVWGEHNLPVESGSWTPKIGASVSDGTGAVYSRQEGAFHRIGNMAFVWGAFEITTLPTGISGMLKIKGLPFPSAMNDVTMTIVTLGTLVAGMGTSFDEILVDTLHSSALRILARLVNGGSVVEISAGNLKLGAIMFNIFYIIA